MLLERHFDNWPPERSTMSVPPTSIEPLDGWSRPPITLSSVVLPDPDGPISARKSPFGMSRFTPFSTSIFSLPRVKYLCTPLILTRDSMNGRLLPLLRRDQ